MKSFFYERNLQSVCFIILVSLLMFLVSGCDVDQNIADLENKFQNLDVRVNTVKNWYSEKGRSTKGNANNWYRYRINEEGKTLKEHHWDMFLFHKNREGKEIIEVNLKFGKTITPKAFLDDQTSNSKYNIQNMLFVKNGTEYDIFIVNYFFKSKKPNLSMEQIFKEVNFGYLNPEYEGTVLLLDDEDALLRRWEFESGKIHLSSYPVKVAFEGKGRSSAAYSWTCEIEDNRYCNWEGDPVGYGGTLTCGGSYEYVCHHNDNLPGSPSTTLESLDPPGGGGGGPGEQPTLPAPTSPVTNNLADPCASEIFVQTSCFLDFSSVPAAMLHSLNINSGIMSMFANATNFDYTIMQGDIISGANAITSKQPGGVVVTMNNSYLNTATKLSIARTMIHENLHAYFLQQTATSVEFAVALHQFSLDNGYLNLPNTHHELMGQYVLGMAISLALWDVTYGNNQNQLDFEYYIAMACGGLLHYDTNQPNDAFMAIAGDKLNEYLKILSDEASNSADSKSNPC